MRAHVEGQKKAACKKKKEVLKGKPKGQSWEVDLGKPRHRTFERKKA